MSDLRCWRLAFACGLASAIAARLALPGGYNFYVYQPPAPPDTVSLVRMRAADVAWVTGFAVTLTAAGRLAVAGWRERRWRAVAYPLVAFLNPLHQPIFLEKLDTDLNYRWWARANAPSLMGRTEAEVLAQVGEPTARVPWNDDADMEWQYAPLPFYWFGSKGQVFFWKGRVRSFEPNDD